MANNKPAPPVTPQQYISAVDANASFKAYELSLGAKSNFVVALIRAGMIQNIEDAMVQAGTKEEEIKKNLVRLTLQAQLPTVVEE